MAIAKSLRPRPRPQSQGQSQGQPIARSRPRPQYLALRLRPKPRINITVFNKYNSSRKQYFSTKFGFCFNSLLEIKCTKFYSDLFRFQIFIVRCFRGYFFPDVVYIYFKVLIIGKMIIRQTVNSWLFCKILTARPKVHRRTRDAHNPTC